MGLLDDLLLQSPSSVTLLGAAVLLLVLFFLSSSSPGSQEQGVEPPGPRPLPLLGNLLLLDLKRPDNTIYQLSKKYGSVFTFYFGPNKAVILAGYKTVKQALVKYAVEFGDRAVDPIWQEINGGHGVTFANGDSWKVMRRFALTNLRDFGMGKKTSEEKIIEETHKLIEVIAKHKGKAFDTASAVDYAVANIISYLIYGSRYEYDDPEFRTMVDRTNNNLRIAGYLSIMVYNTFPSLGKWLRLGKRLFESTIAKRKQMAELMGSLQETLTPQMCRGLVDSFLARQQKLEESGKMNTHFHKENLMITQANLFTAGSVTTATTLRWALLLMAKYPQMQDQVQEELGRVVGSRQVLVEDRKNLPYTDAVIHEILRVANIIPMSFPHATSQDVTFQGFFIKKGTTVFPLLTSVLNDESEWETPHTFNPAHFLDKEGKFVKRDAFIPFSAGRRVCVGEALARMELFLVFTSLLQHFRFTPPPGVTEDELDLKADLGLIRVPSPHQLCAISRV